MRLWPADFGAPGDGVKTADIGLAVGNDGPGDGDAESLLNGLLRHRGPPFAVDDIFLE